MQHKVRHRVQDSKQNASTGERQMKSLLENRSKYCCKIKLKNRTLKVLLKPLLGNIKITKDDHNGFIPTASIKAPIGESPKTHKKRYSTQVVRIGSVIYNFSKDLVMTLKPRQVNLTSL